MHAALITSMQMVTLLLVHQLYRGFEQLPREKSPPCGELPHLVLPQTNLHKMLARLGDKSITLPDVV